MDNTKALEFVKVVKSTLKSEGKQWSLAGEFFSSCDGPTDSPTLKDSGKTDNSPYTKAFNQAVGKDSAAEARIYQKYVSTFVKVREIFRQGSPVVVEEESFDFTDIFHSDGTVAPKPTFDRIIKAFKEGETPIETFRRLVDLMEKKFLEIDKSDALEVDVLMTRVSTAHANYCL